MNIIDNDLLSIQEARVLAERGKDAQQILATYSQESLDKIVSQMADRVCVHAKKLAILSYEETEFGKWQDKLIKIKFICEFLKQRLSQLRCVGIIGHDKQNGIVDIGIPVGVIAAICPSTNPVATTIYNTLIAIKSGNAIVFSPHPRAKESMEKTLDIMIAAGQEAGLPEGTISYLTTVSKAGTVELMSHRCTSLILNTEVPSMLKAAQKTGKPLIYGGMGSGPAFIERTADIGQAARDIVQSKTFDYGMISAAEQSVVVDKGIEEAFRRELIQAGGYFMNPQEQKDLADMLYLPSGAMNPLMVGKSPQYLAQKAGFAVDSGVQLLVAAQDYVSESNPFAKEKLAPVIAYYIEDDWRNACEKCIELLLSEQNGHTMVIHSKDPWVIEQFAIKKPVGRVLVNTPAAMGSMGMTTNLFPAMTLGSGSPGKGITSDNVSPLNLVYIRKVGYGIRTLEEVQNACHIGAEIQQYEPVNQEQQVLDKESIKKVLQQVLKEISTK